MSHCRICAGELEPRRWQVREMFFGTFEAFDYRRCADCGCIQIESIPANLSACYPPGYYARTVTRRYRHNRLLDALRARRLDAALAGRPFAPLVPPPRLPEWIWWLDICSASRLLDVGCGAGQGLLRLRKKGFRHVAGIDPFIESTVDYGNGVVVYRCDLPEHAASAAQYDVVTMHHSLEHIADQHATVAAARVLLAPGGLLLVRLPLCSSWAWEHYREHWVGWDAPRHLYLHTPVSLERLAAAHGFVVQSVHCDSTPLQFTGSERYRRGVALVDGSDNDHFSAAELADFRARTNALNDAGRGDQAGFVFRRA